MEALVLQKYTQPYDPRGWAWMAYLDAGPNEGVCGFGRSEQDALADLLTKIPD